MSPRGEFLATAHAGDLATYLWTNVSLYTHVTLKPLEEGHEARPVQMPTATTRALASTGDCEL